MISLLFGTLILAGIGLGWYGYKASLRIAEWGRGMDECDHIFQIAGGIEEQASWDAGEVPAGRSFADARFHAGVAASK